MIYENMSPVKTQTNLFLQSTLALVIRDVNVSRDVVLKLMFLVCRKLINRGQLKIVTRFETGHYGLRKMSSHLKCFNVKILFIEMTLIVLDRICRRLKKRT